MKSFSTVEQAIEQACLNFKANFFPVRLCYVQALNSPSTPRSTPFLISSLRQDINRTYKVPHSLTLEHLVFIRVTTINPFNQIPSYKSDVQANINHFCLHRKSTPAGIKNNQDVVKKENREDEGSKPITLKYTAFTEALKPDLVQQSILFRGARMVRILILVTPISPTFKNYFVAT